MQHLIVELKRTDTGVKMAFLEACGTDTNWSKVKSRKIMLLSLQKKKKKKGEEEEVKRRVDRLVGCGDVI
ncbi:hypothetical protein TEQG_02868 [Trichophyton equinum CBS 127.97]|uniref:Uncharacterized protein n=1 Tax=Trichophyton equinum (strain ATCC MYA-4606 / CBS 127.97) TaxID=559882 RepID=F2PPL6_TRIEC|nr:hypothetical protein TEQG_02868 [Trichophyton equinum CBS 127.97]